MNHNLGRVLLSSMLSLFDVRPTLDNFVANLHHPGVVESGNSKRSVKSLAP